MKLTLEQIAEIKARAEKASKGPWHAVNYADFWEVQSSDKYGRGNLMDEEECGIAKDNADFLANSRADIPALLAHVEALEAEVEQAKRPWSVTIVTPPEPEPPSSYPTVFNTYDATVEDVGHSDRVLVVKSEELDERIKRLEAENAKMREAAGRLDEATRTTHSLIVANVQADPNYCPYCLRCKGLVRMRRVEPYLWNCTCSAVCDLRFQAALAAAEGNAEVRR